MAITRGHDEIDSKIRANIRSGSGLSGYKARRWFHTCCMKALMQRSSRAKRQAGLCNLFFSRPLSIPKVIAGYEAGQVSSLNVQDFGGFASVAAGMFECECDKFFFEVVNRLFHGGTYLRIGNTGP